MPPITRTALAVLVAAPLLLASCYSFATPSYHPGEGREMLAAIARHGVTVRSAIPGGSACEDPGLIANALHLVVDDPDDGSTRDVWVYNFRERYWDASQASVDACQEAFVEANPGAAMTRLDIPLYRAFGPDWSGELARALEAGLTEAAEARTPG